MTSTTTNPFLFGLKNGFYSAVFLWAVFMCLTGLLAGCASAPPSYQIVGVSGTRYATVFRDGIPLAPGSYIVSLTGPSTADVLVNGRVVGSGQITVISGKPASLRIEVQTGSTVTVTQR